MTSEEMGIHILYIRESVDELKLDKNEQWERLDEHSSSISFLRAIVVTIAFVIPIIGGVVGYFLGRG